MGWGKFDDRYALNRKVRPLSDAAFRLDVSSVLWCNAQLTDGRIERDELTLVSDVKQPGKAATELVRRGRWHPAGEGCGTEQCPTGESGDGWQIHDYLEFNDSKKAVTDRREADRLRKQRKPGPRGKPPREPAGIRRDSERNPDGIRAASTPEAERIPSDPSRTPAGARAQARAPSRPLTTSADYDPTDLASIDAGEAHDPSERTPAQHLGARYAAGVPLSRHHGQAVHTLSAAIDLGYDPAMLERAVDVLIAEQRQCTPDSLRIAIGAAPGNWGSAGRPAGHNTSHLDDLRAAGPGVAEEAFRRLFAVPDPTIPERPALEA